MSGSIAVLPLTAQIVDRSGTYFPVVVSVGSTLIVQRDSGTPAGDPVNVTLSGITALAASTIVVQGGADLSIDSLAGVAAASGLDIGTGGTLTFLPTVGINVGSAVNFTGTSGTLVFDQSMPNVPLLASVSNFTASDTIDFRGVPAATSATITNGQLNVFNGSVLVATLPFVSSSASSTTLTVQSDGNGGIAVGDNLGTVTQRLSGNSSQYTIAVNTNSQDVVIDSLGGRDGTTIPVNGSTIGFSNGVGFIDPSGNAEAVARLYQSILGRQPDVGGETQFTALLNVAGTNPLGISSAMLTSPEYTQRFGALTNAQFVNQLYINVGQAQDGNAGSLLASLDQGTSRAAVATLFSNQSAAVQGTLSYSGDAAESEAYRLYQTALGRAPDPAGLAAFTNEYAAGATSATVAAQFVGSAEFTSRFGMLSNSGIVNQLYENAFGRNAEPGGLNYWTTQLNNGAGVGTVALALADSSEARLDTAGATHDGWVFLGKAT